MTEETIDAVLDANGSLNLTRTPHLSPGPVRVTIRTAARGARRGLADVVRNIHREQIARGFRGRTSVDLQADEAARSAEDAERDRELDAARAAALPDGGA